MAAIAILWPLVLKAADEKRDSLSPEFYRGVCYAHVHDRAHGYGTEQSVRKLEVLQKLGVNWISLAPFGYQENINSERIVGYPSTGGTTPLFRDSDLTMQDDDLRKEVASAHAAGIKVLINPHLWAGDFADEYEWPGTIRQPTAAAHKRWWASYRAFILHYAKVAADSGADMFCIGDQLAKMSASNGKEWRELAKEIRSIPSRGPMPLVYSASWDKEYQLVSFWDALDFIGIAAYFPLDAPENANIEELLKAWTPHQKKIAELSKSWKKPVIFTEVGYRAIKNAHAAPSDHSAVGTPDPLSQAIAYEALFRMLASSPWARGVFIWKSYTYTDASMKDRVGGDYEFRGRPAGKVLQHWYAGEDKAQSPSVVPPKTVPAPLVKPATGGNPRLAPRPVPKRPVVNSKSRVRPKKKKQ